MPRLELVLQTNFKTLCNALTKAGGHLGGPPAQLAFGGEDLAPAGRLCSANPGNPCSIGLRQGRPRSNESDQGSPSCRYRRHQRTGAVTPLHNVVQLIVDSDKPWGKRSDTRGTSHAERESTLLAGWLATASNSGPKSMRHCKTLVSTCLGEEQNYPTIPVAVLRGPSVLAMPRPRLSKPVIYFWSFPPTSL
jgi:hypothetical protein